MDGAGGRRLKAERGSCEHGHGHESNEAEHGNMHGHAYHLPLRASASVSSPPPMNCSSNAELGKGWATCAHEAPPGRLAVQEKPACSEQVYKRAWHEARH